MEKKHNMTKLMDFIKYNDIEGLKEAFKNGYDVNEKTKYKTYLLHYATSRSNIEIIELLIKEGANVNAKDSLFYFTPLFLANRLEKGEIKNKIIKLLEQHGAK